MMSLPSVIDLMKFVSESVDRAERTRSNFDDVVTRLRTFPTGRTDFRDVVNYLQGHPDLLEETVECRKLVDAVQDLLDQHGFDTFSPPPEISGQPPIVHPQ
jgi:hypothetical protein